MKPKPFLPVQTENNPHFVIDRTTGLVFHQVFSRTLYADTDRSGVVYHANYLRYFELGRASLMRDMGYPYRHVENEGYVYPIIDLRLQFYNPLHYDDPFWIYTRPVELERVRIKFDYVITHEEVEQTVCRGFTRHCALNSKGRPTAVDQWTVNMWNNFSQLK